MKIYIYPKGNLPSGQTTISEIRKKSHDSSKVFPIWERQISKTKNILNLFMFYYTIPKIGNEITVSIALSLSYLLRIFPIFLFLNKYHIEVHTGKDFKLSVTSRVLLILISLRSTKIFLLGNIPWFKRYFEKKISYFKNSVNAPISIQNNKEKEYDLGFIAVNIYSKGYQDFIKIFEKLSQTLELTAYIAGPFKKSTSCPNSHTLENFLKNIDYFKKLGGKYFDYIGEEKYDLLGSTRYFIFLSSFEGEAQPMVLLEAEASECQIFATDVGFIKDMQLKNTKIFQDKYTLFESLKSHLNG